MNSDTFEAFFILLLNQVFFFLSSVLLIFAHFAAPTAAENTEEPAAMIHSSRVRFEKDQDDFKAKDYFKNLYHDIFLSEGFKAERALVEDYKD